MSFEFLAVDAAQPEGGRTPLARSPMERVARAAGARFEARDGWNVAVAYDGEGAGTCSWTDLSHLGKLELHAVAGGASASRSSWGPPCETARRGGARSRAGACWRSARPPTPRRCARRLEEAAGAAAVVEVTTAYAALAISGPLRARASSPASARSTCARA